MSSQSVTVRQASDVKPGELAALEVEGVPVAIKMKRAYQPVTPADGKRILVERLWPRGVAKDTLHLSAWLKDAAPSTKLRVWFGHDPAKWSQFRRKYFRELDANPESWRPLVSAARRVRVTLVYSSRDTEHNNAVALRQYLLRKLESDSSISCR